MSNLQLVILIGGTACILCALPAFIAYWRAGPEQYGPIPGDKAIAEMDHFLARIEQLRKTAPNVEKED